MWGVPGSNVMSYKLDWNQIVPRKVNIFIWKAVNDRLPTRANLLLRGLAVSSSLCPLCGLEKEYIHHIILSCLVVSQSWSEFWKLWRINHHPFTYLGIKVGDLMTRIKSYEEIINKLHRWLSKRKLKTLSIGGRLTLLKSVLGSMPRYYMLIKAIHGEDSKIGNPKSRHPSNWIDIVRNMSFPNDKGINLLGFIKKKVGNDDNTMFWEELWKGDVPFKLMYPRVYALELFKNILVASKSSHSNVGFSLRRSPGERLNLS
ncbi:RNA-directed DNA polymerase, eukaryota, reverse transcriptase zinc-binding domain protein [Tanacetum coccineum]